MKKLIMLCSLVLLLSACGGDGGNDMSDSGIRKAFPAADFLGGCKFQEVAYVSDLDANGSYYTCPLATDFTNYENALISDGFNIFSTPYVSAYIKSLNDKGYAWYYEIEDDHYNVCWLIYHDADNFL